MRLPSLLAHQVFKVMFVGEMEAGKTTLAKGIQYLLSGPGTLTGTGDGVRFAVRRRGTAGVDRTAGIDVTWQEVAFSALPPQLDIGHVKVCSLHLSVCGA